jgi:Peptidase MA superfamily
MRTERRDSSPHPDLSLIRILLVLVVVISWTPIDTVRAQEVTAVEDAALAIPELAIAHNEATVDFPEGITFTLGAESADPIANVELLYHAPGRETLSVELPPFTAGSTELAIEQPVDLRAGQLPPGIDVLYHWRITENDGDIVETPEQTLSWADDRYDWTSLEGPRVTVYTYGADTAFQQLILDTAEETITQLSEAYGATVDQRVRLWAYSTREDYASSLPPGFVQWSAGFNRPDLHVINLVLPSGNADEVKNLVPHEVSHQVLYQATRNPFGKPPAWFDEGLAVYQQESSRDRLHAEALKQAADGQVPSLQALNGEFGYHGSDATVGYAFSLTVAMYILDTWGDEGMSHLIDAFAEGVTVEDGVQNGLGITFDELERRWQEDLLADAQQAGVTGTTRFGDDGASPWTTIGEGLALASGTVILGLVVLFALIAGLFSVIRSRRRPDDDEPIGGVRWGEWPEGLELPRALRES